MTFNEDHGESFIALPLPVLPGSVDFQSYKLLLLKIDQLLKQSGLEKEMEDVIVAQKTTKDVNESQINTPLQRRYASYALRCTVARFLTQESYRSFSVRLADSILLRDFCGYNSPYAPEKTPSKSTLQRFESWFDTITLRRVSDMLLTAASDESSKLHNNSNGLLWGIDTDVWLLDSTCMKLDIHFPVDWVLLKDCIKSIIQTIIQIRKSGIRHRIGEPATFLSDINKLSMKMTNASKRSGSKKERKAIFRKIRDMLRRVENHGQRYLEKLEEEWQTTELTEAEMNHIANKMKHTLELVPDVIHQAHERIIGERQVENENKILSIHEKHAQVYNRGKAGAQVEFGLQMLIGENADGLIMHWDLIEGTPKHDYEHTEKFLSRIKEFPEEYQPSHLVGDRGFYSASSEKKIEKANLISNMCPKDPIELKKKLGEDSFSFFSKRRAQTEARIGILKNNFIGKKILVHGYESQERHVAWAVLSHNLWVLARFPYKDLLEDQAA